MYIWFTASSPNEIAKMVIPPLCFGLIIIICVIFICILMWVLSFVFFHHSITKVFRVLIFLHASLTNSVLTHLHYRMKTNWWDKISKPKIDANLGEEKVGERSTMLIMNHNVDQNASLIYFFSLSCLTGSYFASICNELLSHPSRDSNTRPSRE